MNAGSKRAARAGHGATPTDQVQTAQLDAKAQILTSFVSLTAATGPLYEGEQELTECLYSRAFEEEPCCASNP